MQKPAYHLSSAWWRQRWVSNQTLIAVKLTTVLLLLGLLQAHANGISQTITFSGDKVPVHKVFDEIKNQTGYNVFGSKELLQNTKPVSVKAVNMKLEEFLEITLKEQPFNYEISDKTIILSDKKEGVNISPMFPPVVNPPVSGVIRDAEGNPIAGVNIVIKGTKRGVVSDAYGNFKIDAKEGEVLVISSINYGTKQIRLGDGNAPLIVALDRSVSQLDEVQYIAYGTTSKRYSVGNTGTVKAVDIEKQPVQNPLFALQGRVPGVLVTQNTGFANGAFTVQIQGRNSIARGSNPLIVVDGVPLAFELFGANFLSGPLNGGDNFKSSNNPINFINPSDIEAIDILKDAEATAIYGSRAANGAILITTKKGKPGKTKINIGVQQGWSKVGRKVGMLNTRQYLDMRYEAIKNDALSITDYPNYDLRSWDTTRYTDWQKELIGGTAKNTNLTASVSGGTPTISYLIGGTLNRSTNVFPGSYANKTGNIHFNINTSSLNQRFKLSLTGSYAVNNNGVPSKDLTKAALLLAPNAPRLHNEDGTLNWAPNDAGRSTFNNPLGGTVFKYYEHAINTLTSNAQVSYSILRGLTIKSSFGYNNIRGNSFTASLPSAYPPEDRNNIGTGRNSAFNNMNSLSWIAEPQLTFTKIFGNISLDALAGSTFQKDKAEVTTINAEGFVNDLLVRNLASATFINAGYANTIYRYNALFGKLNMIADGKYLVNLSIRRDGS
ncbi:MAG: TonB-dependent receptor plug domain-containing protein, partial [Chitinophagaceae bacterium]|nr:TonB-dependent receptor plug domain-containing protein [Chitinophagaceae bacterium]